MSTPYHYLESLRFVTISDFFVSYRGEYIIDFSQNPQGIEDRVIHSIRSEADWVRDRKSICKPGNLGRMCRKNSWIHELLSYRFSCVCMFF